MLYAVSVGSLCLAFAIAATGLWLVVGPLRRLAFCWAALTGCGAYTFSQALVAFNSAFLAGCLAIGLGLFLGAGLGLLSIAVDSEFFALATLAIQVAFTEVIRSSAALGGSLGRVVSGFETVPESRILAVLFACTLSVASLLALAERGRVGLVVRASGEDGQLLAGLGWPNAAVRLATLGVAGAMAAVGGIAYCAVRGFISPESFGLDESVLFLAMVLLFRRFAIVGVLLGAIAVVALPEIIRLVGLDASGAAFLKQAVFAAALALAILWNPPGEQADWTSSGAGS